MAVYTEVSDEELAAFLAAYDIGDGAVLQGHRRGRRELQLFPPHRATGSYILTLYEKRVARGRPAVLPRPDGASRRPRPHLPAAGPQPAGRGARAARRAARPRSSPSSTASRSAARTPRHCRAARRRAGAAALAGRGFRHGAAERAVARGLAAAVRGRRGRRPTRSRRARRAHRGASSRISRRPGRRDLPQRRHPRRPVHRQRVLPRRRRCRG